MSNLTERTRTQADIKAAKRAEALRANLKRRKGSEAVKIAASGDKKEGEIDAKSENDCD